ncbi:hypothetical protein [Phocaeicola plebeius]|jgi:hypothetical protein|uniref:hypothetical protein n=1 Tax=Phocaeicola plebeius TaxID=310297 RepID=UPI0026F31152|nr:hypothetical protein [Phocaeicola plebeius]
MKTNRLSVLFLAGALILTGVSFTSCLKGDDIDTNQYTGGISLNVFGPSPVARGGELRFLGSGMNQVTAVVIPGCDDITDIKVISDTEIRITVPQEAEPGLVTLKAPGGDITTKTKLTYIETISLESLTPSSVRPGDELTITGEYLNLIHEVIFANEVTVAEENFTVHDRNTIKLIVPEKAQTGKIILSDGEELPNLIYSEDELQVVLPSVAEVINQENAKPEDVITISGENLELVTKVLVPGNPENIEVAFELSADNQQLIFALPADAADGDVIMLPASGVEIVVVHLSMAKPEVSTVFDAEVLGGQEITLNGNNLDLITGVTFPGVSDPVIPTSSSATELKVVVPEAAVSGTIVLNLKNGDVMEGPVLAVKTKCTVVNLPTEVQAGATLELNVENGEQLTGVEVNGSSVEYSLQNSILSFTLPQELTGSVTLKLISGEVFVTYNISVVSLGTLVYGESKVLGSSWSDYVYLESSVFTGATVGQVITVVVSNVQADAQGAFKTTSDGWPAIAEGYEYFPISGNYSLEITQDILTKLQSTGLVIGGVNYTIESVYIK